MILAIVIGPGSIFLMLIRAFIIAFDWFIGWLVLDLDFTDCKASLAELLQMLVADGCGFYWTFGWNCRGEK
jgi:hypothetical protein